MGEGAEGLELEARWAAWVLARNLRSTKISLWLVLSLVPLFGVLDYLLAPREWLAFLYGTRVLVTLITIALLFAARRPFFERYVDVVSASFQVVVALGIGVMTVFMGGLASPYYAGLSLILVGMGLLFVWPRTVVLVTNVAIVLAFVVPNVLIGTAQVTFAAFSNLLFLSTLAFIAGIGQIVTYRTYREQVENQLVIESTKANLERVNEQLKELDRFKSELFANVTHELKTPLTMILTPLELLIEGEMGKLTDAQRGTLQSMLRSGMKLLKLIGDLLDLSKLNESRLRLQLGEHDLVQYLRGLAAQVQPLAQRKTIDLSFESDVPSAVVHCDIEKLERVFVNLLSNAAKFTPPKGKIVVRLEDVGDAVRVTVRDTGIGFPKEMAETIFERFVQVDMGGTRKYGGTGIGLSLARELVTLHGGTIRAESDGTDGATFVVELRKGRDHIAPDRVDRRFRQEDRVGGKRETDHGVGEWQVQARDQFRLIDIDEATEQRIVNRDPDELDRAQSVLVVEDTPDVIRMIHLTLRGNFRVFAAPGGEKGFELATKHLPSLVITDLMMPEVDGMELTRRLRADPRTRHIPIVMLTARGDVEDRVAGFEAGVNAYLTKPFSTRELVSTVRGLVRIQETTADIVLTHSMDSLETVAGGLAHEINNPLNYVRNALALVKVDVDKLVDQIRAPGGAPPEETLSRLQRMFDVAETGLTRIGATVNLMQRYSREGYSRVLQPLDLFAAARDVIATLEAGHEKPLIVARFSGEGRIDCVPEEMHQVLTNLIQNALDAIPSDGTGRVLVTGSNDGPNVVLSVEDNGPGIQAEDRARIFTPFYTTKDVGRGMGLGLTIVRRVVTSLSGTVDVASEIGHGTVFTLRLPRENVERRMPKALPSPELV
ncbi:MAG TPA: ATP-binding protein [Polyangiaceae bacterium]|nr:ATP-binding protein [Polyangiaceae bacterium]